MPVSVLWCVFVYTCIHPVTRAEHELLNFELTSEAMLQLYISLVRPHVEYAATVWSPSSSKRCICPIESVQKFALRMVYHAWGGLDWSHNHPYFGRKKKSNETLPDIQDT